MSPGDNQEEPLSPTPEELEHMKLYEGIGWTNLRIVSAGEDERVMKGTEPDGTERTIALLDL